ncbi:hypothetical protein [uncultured Thiohalocapsa sp.]|uniref:hypothetical protein n=1 Tax=uncultured Thiohalocapsa sp. TaxID=768990 RepID=UPI0025D02A69|nr:hypothetical protein [uncultured Thiohalocapsa sp.]
MTSETSSQAASDTVTSFRPDDLHQLAELGTLVAAARDALSDDMVARAAGAFSEGVMLLDRLTRNDGLVHLLQEMDRPENQLFLISMSNAFTAASRDLATAPPASGGVGGLLKLLSDPGTQEGLRLVALIAARLSDSMREIHHRGG